MSFGGGSVPKPKPIPAPARQADATEFKGTQAGGVPMSQSLISTSAKGLARKAKTSKTSLIGGSS